MVDLASLPPEEKERITRIIMEQHPILGIAFEDDVIVVNIAPGITPVLTSIDGFLIRYESFEINDLSFNTISPEIYSRVAHDVPEDAGPVPEPIPCLRCAHTVLRGGISISHPTVTAGTLGCIVYHNKTLRWEILSNHHVIATDAGVRGDAIYQPGNADATEPEWRQRKVAQLHRWVPIIRADIDEPFDPLTAPNDLDCAVAVPSSNLKDLGISLSRSVIDPIGFPRGAKDPEVGMEVFKIGRTTDVTYGEITSIDATVRVNPANRTQVADYKNLIRTTPMVSGGDSGSLLVEVSTRMAVGLLFAGGYDRVTGVPTGPSYACKMSRVMEALDISIVRPAATTADPLVNMDANPILGGLLTGLTHGLLV